MEREAAFSVGRFQPPTVGHAAMIQKLIDTGKDAFVFVSSVTKSTTTEENPLTSAQKIDFLRKMFPSGVTFVDTAKCEPPCGGPKSAREYLVGLGYTKLTIVGGSDREPTFGPTAPMWSYLKKEDYTGPKTPPDFIALQRNEQDRSRSGDVSKMSATKARGFARDRDLASFKAAVMMGNVTDTDAEQLYNVLRERLPPRKQGGGEEDVSLFPADDDVDGGRRHRKSRFVESKRIRRSKRRKTVRRLR